MQIENHFSNNLKGHRIVHPHSLLYKRCHKKRRDDMFVTSFPNIESHTPSNNNLLITKIYTLSDTFLRVSSNILGVDTWLSLASSCKGRIVDLPVGNQNSTTNKANEGLKSFIKFKKPTCRVIMARGYPSNHFFNIELI